MKKVKRAVGYVVDIPILGTDLSISRDFQKQRIIDYARRENIELVGIYEDENYREDFMNQPGVKQAMNAGTDIDAVIVERVWALSRKKKDLEPFLRKLDEKGVQLVCASYLWDCLSQMVRHRYMGVLAERMRKEAETQTRAKHTLNAA